MHGLPNLKTQSMIARDFTATCNNHEIIYGVYS